MAEVDDPQRAQLQSRLRFEALLADLSSEFVNLQPALSTAPSQTPCAAW